MIESELVKECLKGKQDSQKRLYEHFAHKMLGVCYRYAHSREEAEDFLQESFITVFRKLHQWKGEGELGAWIRRIVVNTSLNCIKSRHFFTRDINTIPIDHIPDNDTVLQDQTNDKELVEFIHQLPTGCKTVFNLYAIEGYSHDEIGKMLGIKASTSRSQFMKARKMLMLKLSTELKNIQNDEQHG
ncbi:MAG: RNA polymerase sigma-70 factor, ECF subfamily [Bacteroidetes bacterium]|nr:MAG: RNA polymerase sigma-70 factor, ECF subfamily [Bacteroidota bacterium]